MMSNFSQQLRQILDDMHATPIMIGEGNNMIRDFDAEVARALAAITHLVEERELEIKEEGWRDGITFAYTIVVTAKPDKHLELLLESALDNYPAEIRQRLESKLNEGEASEQD